VDEATKWVGGLDRLHRARGILTCYDFSATPYAPGSGGAEEALYGWIVSDFGLNDAVESGLVKTPRVVVRDDGTPSAKTYRSRLFHIYADDEVRTDLNRPAQEAEPLPDLVLNAYTLLGKDWLEAKREWEAAGLRQPPVLISVGNRTETAARIKWAFDHGQVAIDELCHPELTLHIDSKVLAQAEAADEPVGGEPAQDVEADDAGEADGDEAVAAGGGAPRLSKEAQAERLRRQVDTVGQPGEPGEWIRHVVSVGMLSEGWDCRTVTHIMGLRAFTSQLLCEQVVGRGLRRTSYEVDPDSGLFQPEYVNIFGVPFNFLPFEGAAETAPRPAAPKFRVEAVPAKAQYAIAWPNVVRVEHVYRPRLALDPATVAPLTLNEASSLQQADLAVLLGGYPDLAHLREIDLKDLAPQLRLQRLVFRAAATIYDQMSPDWAGRREALLAQLVGITEGFLRSEQLVVTPREAQQDELRRRLVLALNMNRIVRHLWDALRFENAERLELVFDEARPVRSTGDMPPWYTSKPCDPAAHSHINVCVNDSTWEARVAYQLDRDSRVAAWAKNDHLGFEVPYLYKGARRKYRPDFFIRFVSEKTIILEVKGQDDEEQQTKRRYLDEWVRAVNAHGGFGAWGWAVLLDPDGLTSILDRADQAESAAATGR
jgi:type III restriction enzyme